VVDVVEYQREFIRDAEPIDDRVGERVVDAEARQGIRWCDTAYPWGNVLEGLEEVLEEAACVGVIDLEIDPHQTHFRVRIRPLSEQNGLSCASTCDQNRQGPHQGDIQLAA
jgi:hypothetical protein